MVLALEKEVTLPNEGKVRLLGIRHGGLGVPVGPMTAKRIKLNAIGASKVLAEERSIHFLPRKMVRRAKAIDHIVVKKIIESMIRHIQKREGGQAQPKADSFSFRSYAALYAMEKAGRPIGITERHIRMNLRDRRQLEDMLKRSLPKATSVELRKIAGMMAILRSYFMADNIMKYTQPRETSLAVIGVAHHSIVQRFLENPRLMKKYKALVGHHWNRVAQINEA